MPTYHVSRSLDIAATPLQIYELVADFDSWSTWSPWLCTDPAASVNVSNPSDTVGASYTWEGELVGKGVVEHLRLEPPQLIADEIRFLEPFKSTASVGFELSPGGETTRLTWKMDGSLPWFLAWMKPTMQSFIAMDFDRGLSMIKQLAETGQILSRTTVRGVEKIGPLRMAGLRATSTFRDVGSSMRQTFEEVRARFHEAELNTIGQAISVYHKFDTRNQTLDYTGGFLLQEDTSLVPGPLIEITLPATPALAVAHLGSYDNLGNAWSAANQYARTKKLKPSKLTPFEIYRNDPTRTPTAELLTDIYLPLKKTR